MRLVQISKALGDRQLTLYTKAAFGIMCETSGHMAIDRK
jgi:hypothetical protein